MTRALPRIVDTREDLASGIADRPFDPVTLRPVLSEV